MAQEHQQSAPNRRSFIKGIAGMGIGAIALTNQAQADEKPLSQGQPDEGSGAVSGNGAWVFETTKQWEIPDGETWAPAHSAIVDNKAGDVFFATAGPSGILVFNSEGKFLRAMKQFVSNNNEGFHDMQLFEEDGVEYIFGAHLGFQDAIKFNAETGEEVLRIKAPKEQYKDDANWRLTGIAVAPDGSIFVGDGYGTSQIHKFAKDGSYLMSFGSRGSADGQFANCHGIEMDLRFDQPRLLIMDRENRRLSHYSLDGELIGHLATHLRRPCSASFCADGEHFVLAEIEGRVSVWNKDNVVVAFVGDNPNRSHWDNYTLPVSEWTDGLFICPHGIHIDRNDNLYLTEWNILGRNTRMKRVQA